MGCFVCKKTRTPLQPETSSACIDDNQSTFRASSNRTRKLPKIETPLVNDSGENDRSTSLWSRKRKNSIHPSLDREHFGQSNDSSKNIINVLLLGESGVGKSTFINAIVNYLTFDSVKEAQSKRPIALMPVSFLMTVGDDFEEHMVRFGEKDPNEDHHHPGQSVTQRCRSYTLNIGTQTKLNLIDTPGMGDTRGLDQDDLNMQHILSFINDLSHLNAVCILLKPNESRLNVVFRSYFTQLIGFLGENVRNNIIFCFTNTRATFFTPGNTGPLLKKMLASQSITDIPYNKLNTFCFDSESFRYLIALENGIKFDNFEREEYKRSWITSVKESHRLLEYICTQLKAYPQNNWHSFQHAQFQINKIIRSILETIRNLLRNIITLSENSLKPQIGLHFTPVSRSSTICNKCNRLPEQYGDFWIFPDELHKFMNECTKCSCSRKRHINIEHRLDYELLNDANEQTIDEMSLNLDQLKQASIDFGYFLLHVTQKSEPNDPIFSFLDQMIEEENQICQEKGRTSLNPKLHKKLNQFKEEYEQKQSRLAMDGYPIDLTNIYKLIQTINEMNIMRKQMNVIHQYS